MKVLVVTGTGTGIGKTVAVAALAVALRRAGDRVAVVKPVQTGLAPGDPGDVDEVRRLAGDLKAAELVRLPAALAPAAAARLAGVELPPVSSYAGAVLGSAADTVLVEGAGGLLVPFDSAGGTVADLAGALQASGAALRVVVVVRAGLGTLNHAALTTEALRHRGLPCAGVVVGSWPRRPDLAMRQNLLDLPAVTGTSVLGRIPARAGRLPAEQFQAAAPGWLPIDWGELW